MDREPRRASIRALAKINASLKVLHKRRDGFHELRTIFQTISLADRLEICYRQSRQSRLELDSNVEIEDNVVIRAARACLDAMGVTAQVGFRLQKRIPMAAGLAGGSSDAAAVLLALPVLAGCNLPFETLLRLGADLGSDVPFFLIGGTVLGVGRGSELYPLRDMPAARGVLVDTGVAIATAGAYRALGRELTPEAGSCDTISFQALVRSFANGEGVEAWAALGENDFQPAAFEQHPRLAWIRQKLSRLGARPALMSGSGSSLFGIFASKERAERARLSFREQHTESFYLVSRARYRRIWWRCLMGHLKDEKWPPRSRYVR